MGSKFFCEFVMESEERVVHLKDKCVNLARFRSIWHISAFCYFKDFVSPCTILCEKFCTITKLKIKETGKWLIIIL